MKHYKYLIFKSFNWCSKLLNFTEQYYNNAYDYTLYIIFFVAKVLSGSTSTSSLNSSQRCKDQLQKSRANETRCQIPATNRTRSKCSTSASRISEKCTCVWAYIHERPTWESTEGCRYARRSKCEGWVRRPIIGICHGMEFISDVPALSIRGILDISGSTGWHRGSLNMQNRIGGHIRSRYVVPAPNCKTRAKHLRRLDTILRKDFFLEINRQRYDMQQKKYIICFTKS